MVPALTTVKASAPVAPMATEMECDVIVVGGGPAGLAFVRALAGSGLTVALIERQTPDRLADPADDGREIALTHRSLAILRALGVWERIDPAAVAPLREARVCDGRSRFARAFEAAKGYSGTSATSGNWAFEEYRRAELERLEARRRALQEESRAFTDFVEELKRAKDREQFDAFMAQRRASGQEGPRTV